MCSPYLSITTFPNLHVCLDGGLEGLGVGTDNLSNLLAVLEEQEGGHGTDAELLGDLGELVDVDLEEACLSVLVGESKRKKLVLL